MKIQNAQLTKDQDDTPLIMQLKRKHRWIAEYVEDLIRGLNANTCPPHRQRYLRPADRTKRLF